MAVIGARPATGPWFLPGRRVRPRPRPRTRPQSARRGRRVRVTARLQTRVDVRPFLVAIVVAAGLALFYLSQSTMVAATGYEIDALEAELAQRRAEQQQLIWAIGQARSPAQITERAQSELKLVPLEEGAVTFAPPPSASEPAD
jgi:cell division protein FtsB